MPPYRTIPSNEEPKIVTFFKDYPAISLASAIADNTSSKKYLPKSQRKGILRIILYVCFAITWES